MVICICRWGNLLDKSIIRVKGGRVMLVRFTRINGVGESKECVVETNEIVEITELRTKVENLYDEDGEFVETRTREPLFVIITKAQNIVINQDTYTKLIAKLEIETL
jgi:hypothetical protein